MDPLGIVQLPYFPQSWKRKMGVSPIGSLPFNYPTIFHWTMIMGERVRWDYNLVTSTPGIQRVPTRWQQSRDFPIFNRANNQFDHHHYWNSENDVNITYEIYRCMGGWTYKSFGHPDKKTIIMCYKSILYRLLLESFEHDAFPGWYSHRIHVWQKIATNLP